MNRKAVFDLVRRLIGRGFRQSEVEALDRALDGADFSALDSVTSVTNARRLTVSETGLDLIKQFEGCAKRRPDGLYESYPDPGTGGAPWTIGWGATGKDVTPTTVWTQEQCDARLQVDIARHARDVIRALGNAPTSQAQFDALVCFHYNTGAIHRATLTKLHKAGQHQLAAREFARWKFAGGRVLHGLVRRRREEAALYRS